MGGLVASSSRKENLYAKNNESYSVDYEPRARGQISNTDAGKLYKAVKTGKVKAKSEFVSDLYNGTKAYIRFASERYLQNATYYDNVYRLTHALLNSDYEAAQQIIDSIEVDNIARACKSSKWYKYRDPNL